MKFETTTEYKPSSSASAASSSPRLPSLFAAFNKARHLSSALLRNKFVVLGASAAVAVGVASALAPPPVVERSQRDIDEGERKLRTTLESIREENATE